MKRSAFVTAGFCAAMSACTPSGPRAAITDLNGSMGALRFAFNEDRDRVRLILLLSPT